MEMADNHAVTPLIYYHLKEKHDNPTPPPGPSALKGESRVGALNAAIPSQARNDLRHAYYENLARNIVLFGELKKMLADLTEQGIKVIVLKGALFAGMLYGNLAVRMMADIDILVKPADFAKVAAYLVNAGYAGSCDVEHVVRERRYHHAQFVKGIVLLEVHKGLAQPRRFKIDMDNIWQRAIRVKIDGVDALRLSNEDILLHLCLHMAYHKFVTCLIWWTDLYEFIRKFSADIDWDYVVDKAIEQRISTAVYLSLYFAKKIMKAEIPPFVLKNLEVSSLRKKIVFLFLNKNGLNLYRFVGKPRIYQLAMELFLIDKLQNQLAFGVEFILRSLELFLRKSVLKKP
jgi:hypothetical protein